MTYTEMSDLALLQLVIWREAQNQIHDAKRGVAHVVLNRSIVPAWWNHHKSGSLAAVILYPFQFSSFNPGDINEKKWPQAGDPAFPDCCAVAFSVINGSDQDVTLGATSYYDHSIGWPAEWGDPSEWINTANIGAFKFFKQRPIAPITAVMDASDN